MQSLRDKGLSYQAIAKLLGISRQRVHQVLSGYAQLLHSLSRNGWYSELCKLIMERDNKSCLRCGTTEGLLVHHIDGDDRDNELSNLATLCKSCHLVLHRPQMPKGIRPRMTDEERRISKKKSALAWRQKNRHTLRDSTKGIMKVIRRNPGGNLVEHYSLQITIPKEVVNEVGLKPGDSVMVSTDGSNGELKIMITKEK